MEQLKPETIIDEKYRVIDTLGVGGMGIVYRVEQLSLNSERALKTIFTDKLSEGVWQRFQREAKAACRLDHSNLVKVFDYGLLEKVTPYYVMEIVQGRTLSARIKILGTLTLDQCLSVFIPTAFALAYAHDKKIIHRDMKPANIMISEDTNGKILDIKILDFGIAKLVSDENHTNALTKPGEVIGSPHFMSPEQSWGGKIDTRSDIYSLGCSMFEALTGLPPFIAKNAVQVIMLHQNAAVPTLAQTAPNLVFSDSIEQIIRVMLAKDPNNRYQSMNELAEDLIAVKGGKQPKFALAQEKLSGRPHHPAVSKSAPLETFDSHSLVEITDDSMPSDTFDSTTGNTSDNTFGNTFDKDAKTFGNQTFDSQTFNRQSLTPNFYSRLHHHKLLALTLVATFLITTITTIVAILANKSQTLGVHNGSSASKSIAVEERFAHTKTLANGQKVSVFSFPTTFTCGSIRSLDGHHTINARGEVTIPFGELFFFRPSRDFLEHPHFFRKFDPEQIAELDVGDRHMFCDENMADINHLTSVRILNLKDVNLSPRCINDLNGLTHLREIVTTNSGLDDNALSQLKRLRHLVFMEAREFTSIQKTIKTLSGSKIIQRLALGNTCLDNESLKMIANNPNLTYLSVPQNPKINDDGLKYLLPLNKLVHLNLVDCQISPQSITTLASLKKLRTLKLNTSDWSRAQVSRLKTQLHKFCKLEEDETAPKKSREVLDQLKEFRTIEPPPEP